MALDEAVAGLDTAFRRLGLEVETWYPPVLRLAIFTHGDRRASLRETAPRTIALSLSARSDAPADFSLPEFELPDDAAALEGTVAAWFAGADARSLYKQLPFASPRRKWVVELRERLLAVVTGTVETTLSPDSSYRPDGWVLRLRGLHRGATLHASPELDGHELLLTEGPITCYRFIGCEPDLQVPLIEAWLNQADSTAAASARWVWGAAARAADEYERAAIAGFEASWNEVLALPVFSDDPWRTPFQELRDRLLREGADRRFRCGAQLVALVLSRSVKWGLRLEQPCLRVFVTPSGLRVREGTGSIDTIDSGRLVDLESGLAWLAQFPID